MGTITDPQQKGLIAAVRDHGVGLAGWHGGLVDSFRNSVDYQFMTGAQWVAHPGNVIDFDISIARSDDPDHRRSHRLLHAFRAVLPARRSAHERARHHHLRRREHPAGSRAW